MISGHAHRSTWALLIASGIISLAIAGCSSSGATPAASASVAAPTQAASQAASEPTPSVEATAEPTEAGSAEGISGAEAKLASISSYRFKVTMSGKGAMGMVGQDSGAIEMTGMVVVKPTKALHFEMSGFSLGDSGAGKMGMTIIGDKGWIDLGTGASMEVPADSAEGMGASFDAFRPEKLFGSTFDSYGTGFKAGAEEQKNGVATVHYTADESVLKGFAGAYGDGTWSSDVWIAKDGGYPVSSSVVGSIANGTNAGEFRITMDITNIDDPANKVAPPS